MESKTCQSCKAEPWELSLTSPDGLRLELCLDCAVGLFRSLAQALSEVEAQIRAFASLS